MGFNWVFKGLKLAMTKIFYIHKGVSYDDIKQKSVKLEMHVFTA